MIRVFIQFILKFLNGPKVVPVGQKAPMLFSTVSGLFFLSISYCTTIPPKIIKIKRRKADLIYRIGFHLLPI